MKPNRSHATVSYVDSPPISLTGPRALIHARLIESRCGRRVYNEGQLVADEFPETVSSTIRHSDIFKA